MVTAFAAACGLVAAFQWQAVPVAQKGASRSVARTVIAGVRQWERNLVSARGKFTREMTNCKSGKKSVEHYSWAFDDGKAREDLMSPDWRKPIEIRAFDGERCYYYKPDASFVSLRGTTKGVAAEDPRDAPREFLMAHLPSTIGDWYHVQYKYDPTGRADALSEILGSKATRFLGVQTIDGLRCYKFQAKQRASGDFGDLVTWWIAPDRGFAPVREERRMFDEKGVRPGRRVITAKRFTEFAGGIWLPRLITFKSYLPPTSTGAEQLASVWTITALSLEVNVPIPENVFGRPKYAPGTTVLAPFDRGQYVVP
jgi:hypothetical protein